MARPNGSRKVRGWIMTPKVAAAAGVSLTAELTKEDMDKLVKAKMAKVTEPVAPRSAESGTMSPTDFNVRSEKEILGTFKPQRNSFGDPGFGVKDIKDYGEKKLLVDAQKEFERKVRNGELKKVGPGQLQKYYLSEGFVPPASLIRGMKLSKKAQAMLAENKRKLADASRTVKKLEAQINKTDLPNGGKGWKATMTRAEADKYMGDGGFFGKTSFWHGNSDGVTKDIRTNGAKPEKNDDGEFGAGFYSGTSKNIGLQYGARSASTGRSAELLELRIYSKNPFIADSKQIQKLREAAIAYGLYNKQGEADIRPLLKAKGYDSIYSPSAGYHVAFDQKQVVTIGHAKISKADAQKARYDESAESAAHRALKKQKGDTKFLNELMSTEFDYDYF